MNIEPTHELDEVVKEFLIESYENLDQLDRDLVTLEKDPQNREGLASIFRTVHTIKGTCGFFDFARLGAVAHVGESLLGRLREGQLALRPEITTALLALVDALRAMLANIEKTGQEGAEDYLSLIAQLTRLQEPAESKSVDPLPIDPAEPMPAAPAAFQETRTDGLSESSIRVDIDLLDKLMTLVGELVLARNQILQFTSTQTDSPFVGTSQHLNEITTELQEGIMKTRLLSIGNIWDKFPRLVRDVSLACGKEVRLELDGKGTELDKSIIEAIKDPLTHLVRNAIDHGIESPDVRLQRGKPAQGRLSLRAFHEGGQVNIEIADDGAGLNPERIKQKALDRGLVSPDQATRLSEREIIDLVFLPGFSTAEKITTVSGRGVGMDVVRTNIEKISGSVDLHSQLGQGTTIKIKIPLTLAIIPALLVTCQEDCYALPQVNLLELVRLDGEIARQKIEWIHGTPVYRLRGNLLPLVHLARELHDNTIPLPTGVLNIVILQADDRQFGLVVDSIRDTTEIVVKPLGKQLKGIPVFAGATILGDGKVALILDVLGLAQRAQVVPEGHARARHETNALATANPDLRQSMVLLGLGADYRLALPLTQVARLEKIPRSALEKSGDRRVVQFRGGIMPLVFLSQIFLGKKNDAEAEQDTYQIVVCAHRGRSVGLVVDRVIDIVEASVEKDSAMPKPGISGSAVIQQRVTDLLDVAGIFQLANLAEVQQPLAV